MTRNSKTGIKRKRKTPSSPPAATTISQNQQRTKISSDAAQNLLEILICIERETSCAAHKV